MDELRVYQQRLEEHGLSKMYGFYESNLVPKRSIPSLERCKTKEARNTLLRLACGEVPAIIVRKIINGKTYNAASRGEGAPRSAGRGKSTTQRGVNYFK